MTSPRAPAHLPATCDVRPARYLIRLGGCELFVLTAPRSAGLDERTARLLAHNYLLGEPLPADVHLEQPPRAAGPSNRVAPPPQRATRALGHGDAAPAEPSTLPVSRPGQPAGTTEA
jgi:hypothetical protein